MNTTTRSVRNQLYVAAQTCRAVAEECERLAEIVEDRDEDWFSTRNLPTGVSRRAFLEGSRGLPSRERDGNFIRVRKDEWKTRRALRAPLPPANDEKPRDGDAALGGLGWRKAPMDDKSARVLKGAR